MTEEDKSYDPLDDIEVLRSFENIAAVVRKFNMSLIQEGYSEQDARQLTLAYVHGMAGGKFAS